MDGQTDFGDGAVSVGMLKPLKRILDTTIAGKLERAFGYTTAGDLVWHVPRRYVTRGQLTDLASLRVGELVAIVAEVREVSTRLSHNRGRNNKPMLITSMLIGDGTATLELTFFNQKWRERAHPAGSIALFSGTVSEYKGKRQLSHPEIEPFGEEGTDPEAWANEAIPVYPATAALPSKDMRVLIAQVLDQIGEIPDPLPLEVRQAHGIMSLDAALRRVHKPESVEDGQRALHSLRWHEAFVLETFLLANRAWMQTLPSTPRDAGALLDRFDDHLPFTLTIDQQQVGEEIAADLADRTSMHRLVQGEVGSGKTLVAVRAMLTVAESGGQSALLAPTEVLATQHLRSIVQSLGPDLAAELHPVLLTGQMPAAERKRALLSIASGQAKIVVGTHALLGDSVQFFDLGLVVIDEQHRFGVAQREALRLKGVAPHTLVLTATPIPRTIAMTAFGDLDVSIIRTMPADRKTIQSFVVGPEHGPAWETRMWQRLAEEVAAGRQGFVVCPAIAPGKVEGDSEVDDENPKTMSDVQTELAAMRERPETRGLRIAPLTGAMASDEKDATMRAFAAGAIDVLVATTVIEVGVDVPNTTTMIVLDADRFGVSQLHQLRGRVGRGEHGGLCLLRTRAEPGSPSRERVDAVAATLDGFALAEIDLEHRREGDVLGSRQSGGRSSLRVLRVTRDGTVIAKARAAAQGVLDADPLLEQHAPLRLAVHRRLDHEARSALTSG